MFNYFEEIYDQRSYQRGIKCVLGLYLFPYLSFLINLSSLERDAISIIFQNISELLVILIQTLWGHFWMDSPSVGVGGGSMYSPTSAGVLLMPLEQKVWVVFIVFWS